MPMLRNHRRIAQITLHLAMTWIGAASIASAADTWTDPYPGIRHLQRDTSNQKIDVLLVDLTHPELRVRATRSDDRGMTTSGFAEAYGLAVAINGDFWQWEGFTTSGLAVADGVQWPGENDSATEGFIAFGADNSAIISAPAEVLEAPEAWMKDVVGGRPLVVDGGVAVDPTTCDPHFCALNPRTAVGLTADGDTLILAVIDGRTGIAAGMTSRQVGELMAEIGAETAINFDGGGSTAMYVGSEGGIVNVPSEGSERVVANHLGVEIVEPIGTLRGTVRSSMGVVIADATVELSTGAMTTTDPTGMFELVDVAAGDTIATASHPEWQGSEVALWVAAQDTTETELVLAPRPPSAGTDTGDPSSDDGGQEGASSGAIADDDSSSAGDDVDPTDPTAQGESTDGCGCTTAVRRDRGLALVLLLGLVAARRRRRRATALAVLLGAGAAGCADPEATPAEPPSASFVRFAPTADGALDFGAVPFPSDLYRDADGRIAIGALPNPLTDDPMFAAIRSELASRAGFCASCNVTFLVDGELMLETVPTDADPSVDEKLDDPIVLVDVDPDSPELGRTFPLRVQFEPALGRLAIRPARGHVLRGGRRYAAVVTSAIRGSDDLPLSPSEDFAAVRDGTTASELARATAAIEPALAALDELGLDRDRIAGLATFTTEDPTADLRSLRASIHAAELPAATVDGVWSGAQIDELLGIPESPGPGIDRTPAEGTDGTAAISHETTAFIVTGTFSAPRFVAGVGTDVGALERDAEGRPLANSTDEVPFMLVVPKSADLSRLPVVVSHHGFNASRTTGFALADTAGTAGFAVLAIDAYQHGQRAASADDRVHAMRGDVDGPDGFAETSQLDVSARVFGLTGGAPDMTLYPGYPLAAFEQFAADVMTTVRFVREGDLAALRDADPGLAMLAFDPERVAYVGNSMGAVVGTSIVVAEPDVHAFVLDVMPGSIVETLAESAEFRPLMETLLLPVLGVEPAFDEVGHAMLFDPTVDLVRWMLEPIDPLALAPSMIGERSTPPPDLLVQLAGHDEVAAPTTSQSVVAAAGIPGEGAFAFAAVEKIAVPLSANFDGSTIAAVRWDPAMHGMLEVSRQSSRWDDPLEPPLVARDATTITNPIAGVHRQIEVFLTSFREDGRATIVP